MILIIEDAVGSHIFINYKYKRKFSIIPPPPGDNSLLLLDYSIIATLEIEFNIVEDIK